jgi:LytS/YehU family sensor histidine kinase
MGMPQIISSLAQRYAEIISNSLGAEVTIIDSNNTRIAGTGEFKSKIGSKIPDYFISSQVIKSGKSQVVFFNEGNSICERCPQKCAIQEKGFICVPLIDNEKVLGAISIICFDNEQIKFLLSDQENILSLISSIGELLILKTKEEEYIIS